MHNRGIVWAYALMLGLTIIVLALAIAPVGSEFVDLAMNQSTTNVINGTDSPGLDCTNSSISNFDRGACIVTDFSIAYFFGGLILIGLAVLGARLIP